MALRTLGFVGSARIVAVAAALAWPAFAKEEAQDFHGRVVRVTDGDTIVVEDGARHRNAVRIVAIDAPEKGRNGMAGQPYADRSRQHLVRLVDSQSVRLVSRGRDDYGRVLARVWLKDVDVGLAQVCAGYAWVYEAFAAELSPPEQEAYRTCQATARNESRGLWRDARPKPPWVWRHTRRGDQGAR